ncbi:MAG TPA: nucleotide disphospho-sugar-binding domain-containing protein, partial [Usitatibacter sp.]|nr:nucleotide disphospho-sugar-binding domain-containing protein [Usitatibacter sp.]
GRGAVRAFAKPIEVAPLMAGASLAVFHAGSGLAAQSLVAGVPMALLPTHLEQFLIAKRAVQAGVGEISAPDHAAPDFRQWFMHLMSSQALREAAQREAAKHRGHSFSAAARAAAQRIAALA